MKINTIKTNIMQTRANINDIEDGLSQMRYSDIQRRRRKLALKAYDERTVVRKSIEVNKLIKFNS